jgi:phosphatidylglycerophosphate synthase
MWPAHILTLSRIPIAIAMFWAPPLLAVALVGLAALTDTLDGNVARYLKRHGRTKPDIGGWLDPVVDKLFVLLVVIALAPRVDPLALALIATREVLLVPISIGWLIKHGTLEHVHADAIGKAATVVQMIAIAIVIGWPSIGLYAAAVAALVGFAAAVHYGRLVARMHRYTRPASQRDMSITASSAR